MLVQLDDVAVEVDLASSTNTSAPHIVFCHPHPLLGGSMDNKIVLQLFRKARARGFSALRFNFRGVSQSSGQHDRGEGETKDLLDLLQWLKTECGWSLQNAVLCGYSFGAWIVAKAACLMPDLGGLFMIAPPMASVSFPNPSGLSLPTYVYAASKDEIVPIDELRTWSREWVPLNHLRMFEGAGHFFVGHTVKLVDSVMHDLDELFCKA